MSRAYLRLDPRAYEKKVIQQGYPLPLFAAFIGALCEAEHQPTRGSYRNERVLRAVLEDAAKHIPELVKRGDLVRAKDGTIYVDGWDEWQEGDWKVGERVRRIRDRRKNEGGDVTVPTVTHVTPATVTGETVTTESSDTVTTVYTPSDGGRQSVIDGGRHSGAVATPPDPPRDRGGRRTRRNGGPLRHPDTDYNAGLESDEIDLFAPAEAKA